MESIYQPNTGSMPVNYDDTTIIGNLIDVSSLGFSFDEQEILRTAGYYFASDLFGSSEIELLTRFQNMTIISTISRIKTECMMPMLGKRIFSNKVSNILAMGNITNFEQLMNTPCRYLNSIPNFSWADMFEIIQKLDLFFCMPR